MAANLEPQNPPCYLQVAASDIQGKYVKGDIVEVYAKGTLRSDWCVLPRWIWAEITDRSKLQVNNYLDSWDLKFVFNNANQNEIGWRYNIAVDPEYISVTYENRDQIKQTMIDFITEESASIFSLWYKISIFGWTTSSITLDIPKPIEGNPVYEGIDPIWVAQYISDYIGFLRKLRDSFNDIFAGIVFDVRRYKFSETAVNAVTAIGGSWVGTHTQALNHIVDKLSE